MASRDDMTLPAAKPRSRKSLGAIPSANAINKENMTMDVGSMMGGSSKRNPLGERPAKKSRSRSIGPGGLDALKESTRNKRKPMAPAPRSILKPTISPLRQIPSRRVSPKATRNNTDMADPFVIPSLPPMNRIALRTEEEQQAAAREREAEEKKAELIARRDARRKSLASRRVSFAPEATLHTWDVVEYVGDSTTSSNSTNGTRRQSGMSDGTIGSPSTPSVFHSDGSEAPSTPDQSDEGSMSPEDQRGLHQKKRRRSSGIPPLDFNNPDDEFFSSSPSGFGSSPGGAVVDDDFDDDDDESESDDDGTAMSMDMGHATDTMASVRSFASDDSSGRLDKALRLAAQQAGTQGIDFDEHGPGAPEEEEEEETEELISFKPWSKKAAATPNPLDQENINPFSPAFHDGTKLLGQERDDEEATMTMEMTRAMGGIIQAPQPEESEDDQTMEMTMTMDITRAGGRILSQQDVNYPILPAVNDRATFGQDQDDGEATMTMDMTKAIGGILQGPQSEESEDDQTMDMTMAGGRILSQQVVYPILPVPHDGPQPSEQGGDDQDDGEATMTMEITRAMGGILQAPPTEESEDDQTIEMDLTMNMTRAVGGRILSSENVNPFSPAFHDGLKLLGQEQTETMEIIRAVGRRLPPNPAPPPKMQSFSPQSEDDRTMDMTMDMTRAVGRIVPGSVPPLKKRSPTPQTEDGHTMDMTMDMTRAVGRIVPGPAPLAKKRSPTPQTEGDETMDMAMDMTRPVGRIVPQEQLSRTEGKKLLEAEVDQAELDVEPPKRLKTPTPKSSPATRSKKTPKLKTPTPKSSPAKSKKTPKLSVNPPSSSLKPPARETPEPQRSPAKTSLPDMMAELNEAMTPKKKVARMQSPAGDKEEKSENYRPLKGRKSLHVGAAKGILGKRPAELDDDNTDDEGGTKRLKNFQGSPVKNVKLQKPPVKEELTGRLTRAQRKSLEASNDDTLNIMKTPTKAKTPAKTPQKTPKTPAGQDRFKDAEKFPEARTPVPFKVDTTVTIPLTQEESPAAAIQIPAMKLQDFLDMTSIRFMELTTTKRRHTVAPNSLKSTSETSTLDNSLESCVVAGACTLPMLELFQHSCHELKRYISEGRKLVKEIEQETATDNPPLFQEYVLANADMRAVMDTQFNTVKANARLLSKGMWYEWRRELLKGLRAGLVKISTGFDKDEELFAKQQELLDSVLPELEARFTALVEEEELFKASAEEIGKSNPEDLAEARECLVGLKADNSSKLQMIEHLRAQIAEKDAGILKAEQRKTFCFDELREAERIRQECRGWSSSEVKAIKSRVDKLEKEYGWTITGVQGSVVSMALKGELECVFDAAGFKNAEQHFGPQHMENSRIDLWYIAANREVDPIPLTEEKKFFVDGVRDYIRGMSQQDTTIKQLLDGISLSWKTSMTMLDEIKQLNKAFPVIVEKTGDESIVVKSSMLLKGLRSKVVIDYHITTGNTVNEDEEQKDLGKDVSGGEGLQVRVKVDAKAVYGERFNEGSMGRFLNRGVAEERAWAEVVEELEGRLIARGKK